MARKDTCECGCGGSLKRLRAVALDPAKPEILTKTQAFVEFPVTAVGQEPRTVKVARACYQGWLAQGLAEAEAEGVTGKAAVRRQLVVVKARLEALARSA